MVWIFADDRENINLVILSFMGFFLNIRKKAISETFFSVYCSEKAKNPNFTEEQLIEAAVFYVFPRLVDEEAGKFADLLEEYIESIMKRLQPPDLKRSAVVNLWMSWKSIDRMKRQDFKGYVEDVGSSEEDIIPWYEKALEKYKIRFPQFIN